MDPRRPRAKGARSRDPYARRKATRGALTALVALVAAGKFKRWPVFATGQTGGIALQNHEDKVGFRNIKVRALT